MLARFIRSEWDLNSISQKIELLVLDREKTFWNLLRRSNQGFNMINHSTNSQEYV